MQLLKVRGNLKIENLALSLPDAILQPDAWYPQGLHPGALLDHDNFLLFNRFQFQLQGGHFGCGACN
jgi:hypothetical protein